MRIYKRGDNWCIDYLYQGQRKRKRVGPNRKEAEAVLAKIRSQIVEGVYFDVKRNEKVKFSEMAKRYMDNHSSVNNSPSTLRRNPYLINTLSRHFGEKYLYDIRELNIEQYKKNRLGAGVKHATINRETALLRSILNKAKGWGIIKTELPKIKAFKVDNTRVRYLEELEARKLVQTCQEPLKSIVLVALNTGLRRSEMLNLKWHDINFTERFLTVRETKSKKNRHIPMNQQTFDVLHAIFRHTPGDYVFPGDKPGTHLSESYVSNWFGKTVKEADIKDFHLHDLRHTFASWLVMSGIDLATVQQLLGHQNYQMTLKYAHLSPEHRQSAVDVLARRTGGLVSKNIKHGTNLAQTVKAEILENANIVVNQ